MLPFKKLVDETQKSQPPKAPRNHNLLKFLILLPLRAIQFPPFHFETPYPVSRSKIPLKHLTSCFLAVLLCTMSKKELYRNVCRLFRIHNYLLEDSKPLMRGNTLRVRAMKLTHVLIVMQTTFLDSRCQTSDSAKKFRTYTIIVHY